MYHTVLFDLDGTLTDSAPGITNSVAYALRKWGIEEKNMEILRKFVGPPLDESFAKYYGFPPEKCWKAIEYYREMTEFRNCWNGCGPQGGGRSSPLPSRNPLRSGYWNTFSWLRTLM